MPVIAQIKSHAKTIKRDILNEPLNRGRRIKLLSNYLLWHLVLKKRRSWVLTLENGYKTIVKPVPDDDAGAIGIWNRNMDYHDTILARNILKKGDFIVDAGCNVGNRTLALADLLGGALLIDAGKEAVARTREHLALNQLDPEKFIVIYKAVGDMEGIVRFTNRGGASTLNKVVEHGAADVNTVEVEMTTIDKEVQHWGKEPAYIKIDVEGNDLNALKGALRTLQSGAVKLVKFENLNTNPLEPILDFFKMLEWRVFAIDGRGIPSTDPEKLTSDMNLFAMPGEKFRTRFEMTSERNSP
jgi:FkbM family methyltransferase